VSQSFSLTQRLKIALGGFVSFVGLMVLSVTILTMTNSVNLEGVVHSDFIIAVVVVVGLLDVVSGFLLFWTR
jgi:hypothetical protein